METLHVAIPHGKSALSKAPRGRGVPRKGTAFCSENVTKDWLSSSPPKPKLILTSLHPGVSVAPRPHAAAAGSRGEVMTKEGRSSNPDKPSEGNGLESYLRRIERRQWWLWLNQF